MNWITIKCPRCGRQIPMNAAKCPKCQTVIPHEYHEAARQKLIRIILILFSLLIIGAGATLLYYIIQLLA